MPDLLWFEWGKCESGYSIVELDYDEIYNVTNKTANDKENSENSRSGLGKYLQLSVRAKKNASDSTIRLLKLCKYNWDFFADHSDFPYFIIPKTDVDISYRPLERHSGIFMEFASSDDTFESVNYLANKYGLLDKYYRAENLVFWQNRISSISDMVKQWEESRNNGNITEFIDWFNTFRKANSSVILKKFHDARRPSLKITPNSLYSAIELQFAQAVSADASLRKCAMCPNWFSFGTGTGRRKSAHYCSPRCRKAFWKKENG